MPKNFDSFQLCIYKFQKSKLFLTPGHETSVYHKKSFNLLTYVNTQVKWTTIFWHQIW